MSHKINGKNGEISYTCTNLGSDSNYYNNKDAYGLFLEMNRIAAYKKLLENNNISSYDTIIDVGCSWGAWYNTYNTLFNKPKIIGIEQYEKVAKQAEKLYDKVYIKSIEDLDNIEEKGLICCNGMLVHILEEEEELKILKKMKELAKGSHICCAVLNCNNYGPNMPNIWYGPNSKAQTLDYYYNLFKKANLKIIDQVGTFINPINEKGNKLPESMFPSYFKLAEEKRRNNEINKFAEIQFLLK